MQLLELAAQSVRGFSPTARVALKAGYVVLKSPSETPSPLAGLLSALCFPDGRGGDAGYLAPGAKAGKAGFSFQGNDQAAWRLVRELGGSGSLHKLNKANGQFEVVTQDSTEMAQMLRATVGLPPRTTFEQLFSFQVSQLPSRRPRVKGGAKAKAASGISSADAPPEEVDHKARLAALEKELAMSKEVAELQFRQDGLQAELFKLEAKVKTYEELKLTAEEARKAATGAATINSLGLPADIVERVKRYPADVMRRDEALKKLEEERHTADQATSGGKALPLYQDAKFMGALMGGVALVVAGAFFEGAAKYVAMLGIPAFSYAALLAFRFIDDAQHFAMQAGKLDVFSVREKKINDEFAVLTGPVRNALKAAKVETAEEFVAFAGRQAELEERSAQSAVSLIELEADPETSAAIGKTGKLRAEQEKITAALLEMSGGYIRDPKEVEREILRTREAMAASKAGAPAAAEAADSNEPVDDPVPALMLLGADLFNTDLPTLWGVLRDRSAQYLAALTDRRFQGAEVDKDGHAKVLVQSGSVPAAELPPKDLDLLYISVRLTLIEKFSSQAKVPVIFEDTFCTALEAPRVPLLLRMLKHLGTLTQVLHVTPASYTAPPTDPVLAL